MPKFIVTVERASFMQKDIEVEAPDANAARSAAYRKAHDLAFTLGDEVDSDYEIQDVREVDDE